MAAAHSRGDRWIVAGMILGFSGLHARVEGARWHGRSANRQGCTIQEIAARDATIHAECTVEKWICVFEVGRHFLGSLNSRTSRTQQFLHGSMGFVDRGVSISRSRRVGVCNRYAAKRFAGDFAWTLSCGPFGIEKIVVFVCVAMRPAIDGNRVNITRGIEAAGTENAAKLVADITLEGFKRSREQITAANFMLVAFRKSGIARRPFHAYEDWLVRRLR